jgi:hypothetical protein
MAGETVPPTLCRCSHAQSCRAKVGLKDDPAMLTQKLRRLGFPQGCECNRDVTSTYAPLPKVPSATRSSL